MTKTGGLEELDLLGLDGPKQPPAPKPLDPAGDLDLFAGIGGTNGNLISTPVAQQPQPQTPVVAEDKFTFDLLGGGPAPSNPTPAYASPKTNFGTDLGFDLLGTSTPALTPTTSATQPKPSTLDTLDMLESAILAPGLSQPHHGGSGQKLEFVAMDDGNVIIRFHCTKVASREQIAVDTIKIDMTAKNKSAETISNFKIAVAPAKYLDTDLDKPNGSVLQPNGQNEIRQVRLAQPDRQICKQSARHKAAAAALEGEVRLRSDSVRTDGHCESDSYRLLTL